MAAHENDAWLSATTVIALLGVSDAGVRALVRDGALEGRWISSGAPGEEPQVVVSSRSVARCLSVRDGPSLSVAVARRGAPPTQASPSRLRGELSSRERDVLDALVAGASHADMAAQLGLKLPTVSAYLMRLYRRLGVSGPHARTAAIAQARRFGLLP
jgi:DNA-binding NarL/FixJ family response regulator